MSLSPPTLRMRRRWRRSGKRPERGAPPRRRAAISIILNHFWRLTLWLPRRSGSSPVHLITSPADLQVHYYTQVENRPSEMNIFASGTGYSHRITMGSQGPPPPAVKGLYSIISRGGINAVKQKVVRENYILKLTRAAELEECGGFGEDWYDSDCYD